MDLMVIQRAKTPEQLVAMQIQPTLLEKIEEAMREDPKLQEFREQVEAELRTDMQINADGTLRFGNRVCMLKGEVRQEVLLEAHSSAYSIHPGGTKMYQSGSKATILVARDEKVDCLICGKVFSMSTSEG